MNRAPPPVRVPTLTEVVEESPAGPGAPSGHPRPDGPAGAGAGPVVSAGGPIPGDADVEAEEIVRRIGAELQAHIDRVVEARVRSALEPLLAEATAQAVDVARRELASTLRDGLARALAQEKSRHRGPPGPR